ncbi:MAG: YkgJ family cysteine cluster protein [Alphaproteobacteria bacterium]|nr:YkgJ family cysteine cluster protein [Alphaproteobacteria bacterium]
MTNRPILDKEIKADIFSGMSGNPVVPVQLRPEDTFCFSCHKGVPCWNACCHGADITLTPLDILRLSEGFGIRPREFLAKYTVPAMWEAADLPVAKIKMGGDDGKGPCPFMTGDGCSVYAHRPATCRYYPLGLASVKMKGAETRDDFHFLVKETHCQGHASTKEMTVAEYCAEQGLTGHEAVDRGWIDIIMKMASWQGVGGPMGQGVTSQTKKMFFMVSTDVDGLRSFVFTTKFLETYDIAPEDIEALKTDDEGMLRLGLDWMKNVLFNEKTLAMKEAVLRASIAKIREETGAS